MAALPSVTYQEDMSKQHKRANVNFVKQKVMNLLRYAVLEVKTMHTEVRMFNPRKANCPGRTRRLRRTGTNVILTRTYSTAINFSSKPVLRMLDIPTTSPLNVIGMIYGDMCIPLTSALLKINGKKNIASR